MAVLWQHPSLRLAGKEMLRRPVAELLFRGQSFGFRTSGKRLEEEIRADSLQMMHKPTNFQRKYLVWTRVFKSEEEIPNSITMVQLTKAKDIGRIYFTTALVIWGSLISATVILYSRHERNKRLDKNNLEYKIRVAQYTARVEKERAAAGTAAEKERTAAGTVATAADDVNDK